MLTTPEVPPDMESSPFRCGYVAIVGAPNVGKSTLMNLLLDQKLSIVTDKPQTTRHKILGIRSAPEYQIIFLDTPGVLQPKYRLHEVMMDHVMSAIGDADLLLYMIDCTRTVSPPDDEAKSAIKIFSALNKPVFLLVNKIDKVRKDDLIPIIATYSELYPFKEIFPISALNSLGIDPLMPLIVSALPVHPPLYPPDIVSEHSEKFFVSEIIREKIFELYREEIPYSTTVDIIAFQEREGKKTVIEAEIYVERDSQKGILIGKQGKALKQVGELARKDIETFLQQPVFLTLYVKVREQWRDKNEWLNRLGYRS